MYSLLLLLLLFSCTASSPPTPPTFPTSFTATVTITSNLLPLDTTYPPRTKTIHLAYSLPLATVKVTTQGRTYVRSYQTSTEYLLKTAPHPSCHRSHLPTTIPAPILPHLVYVNDELVNGVIAEHYVHETTLSRVHMYFRRGLPVSLVHEEFHGDKLVRIMTYDYSDVKTVKDGEWEEEQFGIDGYDHDECELDVGGYPYVHLFHHYLRV